MNPLVTLTILATVTAPPACAGDRLYRLGIFEAAATEYLRQLHQGTPDSNLVRFKLAFGYAAANETEPAAAELRTLAGSDCRYRLAAGSALAGLYVRQGRLDRARFELAGIVRSDPGEDDRELNRRLAWLELSSGFRETAADRYAESGRPDLAKSLSRPPARRSPELALALSALLPGAGEVYAGRFTDGLMSLLVTGAGATGTWYAARSGDWVSAGLVFSTLFLRFYQGARHNAADRAEDFNRAALRDYVGRLNAEPDWFGPAERLTGLRWSRSDREQVR